jgi:two-component system, OmpR family, sensor histidine kinase BaeS
MSLRLKIALGFAAVALTTAAVIAITAPPIIGRGFSQIQSDGTDQTPAAPGRGPGQGQGQGNGPANGGGPQAHAAQVQQETTEIIILVALGAALAASVAGFVAAGLMARPLTQLARASRGVAGGDLRRRSGLADRGDEFGDVGRSFDEMAASLQRADDQRRRFVADVVHELRTPLTVIEGTAGAVEEGIFPPEARHMRTIREQTQLLSRIVDDLRTIGLAEAGELSLEIERVDLAEVASATVDAFAARAAAAGVGLSADFAPGCAVDGDAARLRQVLAALTDNALRHTPRDGRVQLVGRRNGAGVRVSVEDTGGGIAPEDLPRVFDRFYQADPSRDRRTGTSGLGLSIVRALVEAHGGYVGADNRPGGGTSVWVDLPASRPPDQTTP